MLNSELPHLTSGEVVVSQISSYFQEIENGILIGDCNKRYTHTVNTSYGPGVPVQAGSFTTLVISPQSDNCADIYNGYINAEMICKFSASSAITKFEGTDISSPHTVWVGFKDAMDSIEKYEILSNGISIYAQNYAIEESFITSCALPESARRSDVFSRVRHKDVFNKKYGATKSCGVYLDLGKEKWSEKEYTIKLKIDLRRFLPLSNIKYLPAFGGKIELRVLFSTAGMVATAVNPKVSFKHNVRAIANYQIDNVCCEFVPIGKSFKMITKYTAATTSAAGKLEAGDQKISVDKDFKMTTCESIVNCFGIDTNVYSDMVRKYSQTALTFPTQTLSIMNMSNVLNGVSSKSVQTVTPRFVDTFGFLFPLDASYRTVFKNPLFNKLVVYCGGYGSFPNVAISTAQDPRLFETIQNALNVNSDSSGLNKDVVRALATADEEVELVQTGTESFDLTNFLVAFATETDNTFQQGMTSNTPIQFDLRIDQDEDTIYKENVLMPPIVWFLLDSTFSIQIRPDGGPPIVEVGAYDITSPVMA